MNLSTSAKHDLTWEQAVQWLRNQAEQEQLVNACYYDDPITEAATRFAESEEFQAVLALANLKVNSTVIDFGAGRGIGSYGFARLGHDVTALEPDASDTVGRGCIEVLARLSGVTINVSADSAEHISAPDNIFDLAYCRAALHHARSLQTVCEEVFRVLKPGGMLIATREHVLSHETDLPQFLAAHPLHHLYGGEMAYTLTTYLNSLQSAGFRTIKTLGPRESVINAYPASLANLDDQSRRYWSDRLRRLGRWISRSAFARTAALRRLDHQDQQPGRLYSFIAIKPR
ncbi:methyltransferase domain-containing protein [Cyanobium sp. Cruz CV13-4-11]|uniref:class I SAM-dependent methyltransferase n=1 Tax=unclassified Cyanobium TaxID=2627006 RepID=UPI0020CE3539|nr:MULTISPECIES: class I SAM-dependent methyltransferase [unclassified Cyanobium]MCP9900660.1 methyltransferase domain-containing protein [Cyanobium sp. Cruz CV11-17]MCP9921367.1 methyltransferase domain-containing protein [Cyanobium sp. Cruz CV13-4-11]